MSDIADAIRDRLALHGSYRVVFDPGSPHVRRVLRHLCKVGHVLDTTFVAGDPYQTALHEGERRMVLSLLRFIHKNPESLIKQLEEQAKDNE